MAVVHGDAEQRPSRELSHKEFLKDMAKQTKSPRPTELDRAQTTSLIVVLVVCVACAFIPYTAVKIIAAIVMISLVVGLGLRVWRDRSGRW